jgi:hypothetical protein
MKKSTLISNNQLTTILCALMVIVFTMSFAQNPYVIHFQDDIIEIQENIDSFEWNQMPVSAELENGYLGWVQFYETPNQIIQDRFKSNDLELLEYISNGTYLFYFPASTSISF